MRGRRGAYARRFESDPYYEGYEDFASADEMDGDYEGYTRRRSRAPFYDPPYRPAMPHEFDEIESLSERLDMLETRLTSGRPPSARRAGSAGDTRLHQLEHKLDVVLDHLESPAQGRGVGQSLEASQNATLTQTMRDIARRQKELDEEYQSGGALPKSARSQTDGFVMAPVVPPSHMGRGRLPPEPMGRGRGRNDQDHFVPSHAALNRGHGSAFAHPSETALIHQEIANLSRNLAAISARLDAQQQSPPLETFAKTEETLESLRQAVTKLDPSEGREVLDREVRMLSRKIDDLLQTGVDPKHINRLFDQMVEMREMLAKSAKQSTMPTSLEERLAALASQIEKLATQPTATITQDTLSQMLGDLKNDIAKAQPDIKLPDTKLEQINSNLAMLAQKLDHALVQPQANTQSVLDKMAERLETVQQALEKSAASQTMMLAHMDGEAQAYHTLMPSPELQGLETTLAEFIQRFEEKSAQSQDLRQGFPQGLLQESPQILQKLEAKIEQLASLTNHTHNIETGLRVLSERLDNLQGQTVDTKLLESAVRGLFDKLSTLPEGLGHESVPPVLDQRLSEIADRLNQHDVSQKTLESLERTVIELGSQLEALRQTVKEPASYNSALPEGAFPDFGAPVSELKQNIDEIKSAQFAAERKTHLSLEAVNKTLEKMVERLSQLDRPTHAFDPIHHESSDKTSQHSTQSYAQNAAPSAIREAMFGSETQAPVFQHNDAQMRDEPRTIDMPSFAPSAASRPAAPKNADMPLTHPDANRDSLGEAKGQGNADKSKSIDPAMIARSLVPVLEVGASDPRSDTKPSQQQAAPKIDIDRGIASVDQDGLKIESTTPKMRTRVGVPTIQSDNPSSAIAALTQSLSMNQDDQSKSENFLVAARKAAAAAAKLSPELLQPQTQQKNKPYAQGKNAEARLSPLQKATARLSTLTAGFSPLSKFLSKKKARSDQTKSDVNAINDVKINPKNAPPETKNPAKKSAGTSQKNQIILAVSGLIIMTVILATLELSGNDSFLPSFFGESGSAPTKTDPTGTGSPQPPQPDKPQKQSFFAPPEDMPIAPQIIQSLTKNGLGNLSASSTSNPTLPHTLDKGQDKSASVPSALIGAPQQIDSQPVAAISNGNAQSANLNKGDNQNAFDDALKSGNPLAQYEMAERLTEGRGLARDPIAAVGFFEKAASQNLVMAQYRIGIIYEKAIGTARDLGKARRWYEKAASAGHIGAMYNLAVILADGGAAGKPDYEGAANLFRTSAEFGLRDSQFNLAILYAKGLGVTKDFVKSYAWFSAAANQGDSEAGKKRDELAARLDAKTLSAARTEAANFKAKLPDLSVNELPKLPASWQVRSAGALSKRD